MSSKPVPEFSAASAVEVDVGAEIQAMQHASEEYREILREHLARVPDLRAVFEADMRSERLDYGPHRMLCNTLRPHFLGRGLDACVRHVVTTLTMAMHRMARHALEHEEMQDALGVTAVERDLLGVEPGYRDLTALSRLDTFVSGEGVHLVEYNAECPTGAGYNQRLFRVFDRLPPLREFAASHVLEKADGTDDTLQVLLACWREWGGEGTPHVGIVDWDHVVTRGEFEIFAEWFNAHDVPTVIVDPRALELRDGRLYGAGQRIDLVYRRLLTAEFIERRADCAVFEDAYRRQAACFVNNFRSKLLHKKLIFGLLWDPRWQSLLSEDERMLVRRHVPWTQRVQAGHVEIDGERVDLLAHAAAHQAELVLKPNDDYGGKGLLLGSDATQAEWRAGIERVLATGDDYVLQQRIPLFQAPFPDLDGHWQDYYVDLDPFFYRERMFGYMSRMSTRRISNVSTGGGQMPTYVLPPAFGGHR